MLIFKNLKKLLFRGKKFIRNEVGAVILLYGLAAIPVFGILGLAIDVGRILYVDSILAGAVDAAAIAGAKAGGTTANITQQATSIFNANLPPNFIATIAGPNVAVSSNSQLVTVTASGKITTTFMTVFGQQSITVNEAAAAQVPNSITEVVLALDNTGSMSGTPMATEIQAATTLLNTIYGGPSINTVTGLYVGVVPFTTTVNINMFPGSFNPSTWLNSEGVTAVANTKLYPNIAPIANKSVGGKWMGCIEARVSPPAPAIQVYPVGMDISDAPPTGKGLFTPFLYPSTQVHAYVYGQSLDRTSPLGTPPWGTWKNASSARGDNDFLLNGSVPAETNPTLYFGDNYNWNATSDGNNGVGPNLGCPVAMLPLTASQSTVQATINNMKATFRGGTMINLGLNVAWWVISPNWTGLWPNTPATLPMPYGQSQKFIILMTDGENQWYDWPTGDPGAPAPSSNNYSKDADYTGYGRLGEGRSGTTVATNTISLLNTRMSNMCATLQSNGITIFTVLFPHGGGISTATQTLFQNCASNPSYYFYAASNAELIAAFQAIGNSINQLRLTWPGKP